MVQTTIRLDSNLYEKIVKQAEKDKRSINAEISYIFEEYLRMVKWNKEKWYLMISF